MQVLINCSKYKKTFCDVKVYVVLPCFTLLYVIGIRKRQIAFNFTPMLTAMLE